MPILLGRVGEEPLDVVGEVGGDETPEEDESAVGHVRAPDDEEAELEREADEKVEREVEEAGTYKLEIQIVVGADL